MITLFNIFATVKLIQIQFRSSLHSYLQRYHYISSLLTNYAQTARLLPYNFHLVKLMNNIEIVEQKNGTHDTKYKKEKKK